MKICLSGANGQLATAIQKSVPKNVDLISFSKGKLDIENSKSLEKVFKKYKPDWFINCAAFTQVDEAEKYPEKAYSVNAYPLERLATYGNQYETRIFHISTDYVFDGSSSEPYDENHRTVPTSAYGKSKLLGEQLLMSNNNSYIILRTAWVYSAFGKNFLNTILKSLYSNTDLNIVSDQFGSPTSTFSLASIIWRTIDMNSPTGVFHWVDKGCISWYDFALEIQKQAINLSIIKNKSKIRPIKSDEFESLVNRPKYSVLNSEKMSKVISYKQKIWIDMLRNEMELLVSEK